MITDEEIEEFYERERKIKSRTLTATWCEDCKEYVESPMMVCRYDPSTSRPDIKIFPKPITPLLERLRAAEAVLNRIATELYPAEYYQEFASDYLSATKASK